MPTDSWPYRRFAYRFHCENGPTTGSAFHVFDGLGASHVFDRLGASLRDVGGGKNPFNRTPFATVYGVWPVRVVARPVFAERTRVRRNENWSCPSGPRTANRRYRSDPTATAPLRTARVHVSDGRTIRHACAVQTRRLSVVYTVVVC